MDFGKIKEGGLFINSIKKNFLYNAFYNVLTLIIPLVTTPYISRIMGAERIGIYSYAYSIATYFGLFILLGLNNYGNRTIASVRDDKNQLSKTFCSIYAMQLIMSLIVIVIYVTYVLFLASDQLMAWIQLIYLISVALDINWFFFGMEQFKLTVTRNTIIKILNLIFIFILVKSKSDLYIYGLIMVCGPLLSQFILWMFIKKYVMFKKVSLSDIGQHIKPNLILFIPVIAISLYTIMDRVMLGMMSSMTEVVYYENSNKLTQIPVMAISSLGTVMLPRISNMISNGKKEESIRYIQKSLIVSVLLSTSMAFGLCAVSNEFVPIFYGSGFDKCKDVISILVLSSIFISWANVIRTQYLIPNKKDKIYIVSVFLGAIVNVGINFVLIPKLMSIGAAIGTICAEFIVCAYQTYKVRNELDIKLYIKQSAPLLLVSIVMCFIVLCVPSIKNTFITLAVKVLTGIIAYVFLLIIFCRKELVKIIK